jgi:hypothetical protein
MFFVLLFINKHEKAFCAPRLLKPRQKSSINSQKSAYCRLLIAKETRQG